MHRITENNKKA